VSRNRQSGHVGNLGDIIKHAALVELASMLGEMASPVSFVDTNTFLLHAPLANAERFGRESQAHVDKHPVAARYLARERESLARTGHYRCSSGLVLDVLGDRRACAVLGEANGLTRAELKEELREEGHENVHVVDDASAIDRGAWVPEGSSLLVHVDPFALTPEVWAPMAPALDALSARSSAAVFVLYSYTRAARTVWPTPPTGTIFIAENRGAPHEVAIYASCALREAVGGLCSSLGWSCLDDSGE
jgi:23S rRNA A2030 N6-methylase RlmJ